ncbi:MAG: hypothetical protein PVG60_08760 [Desulfarculaceae bacterium]|jgi:hypothetical protein
MHESEELLMTREIEYAQVRRLTRKAPFDPVLQTLLDLAVPSRLLAQHLGIDKSTMSYYATGRRHLPKKYRPVLVEVLKRSLQTAPVALEMVRGMEIKHRNAEDEELLRITMEQNRQDFEAAIEKGRQLLSEVGEIAPVKNLHQEMHLASLA